MKETPATTHKKSSVEKEVKENSFPVVAIGASAGGLEAIIELLKNLPSDTGMSFIYVQHLSPDHKSMLTEILSKHTKMKVQEIDDMDKIKPDNVFIIPHNKGIEVTDGHIKLIPRAENSSAISIDILFSSLAHAQKERVIGIILSGSASDGTAGMKAIKHEGGLTFAQDNSAKFVSMPQSAIAGGVVDFILSPKEIALELGRLSQHPFIKSNGNIKNRASMQEKGAKEELIDDSNPDLKIILNHLRKATGVDFGEYKMTTIIRRIIRRMLLYKMETLKEYAKYLDKKNEEIDILYQDLLINVTSFFRDTDTHTYLKENLFPKLLKRKKTGEKFRIWVPACASGEEAYSIAMLLLEIQESIGTKIPVQIFATDLSAQAIRTARIGLYSKQQLETVSPERIQRFFTKTDGGYRVNKSMREICVFAPHNILTDPPFSRLDFISCCNLFIYLDNAAQKKAVSTFHFALNDDGYLMLGKSETISQSAHLFTRVDKKYKIFSRKINPGTRTLPQLSQRFANQTLAEKNIPAGNKTTSRQSNNQQLNNVDSAIDAVLLSEFMPASVAINHQMEIVQFRGTTDLFLTHPKGKANLNILKMARPEIAFELRNAIAKAIKTKKRVHKSDIEIKTNVTVQIISVEVVPLQIQSDEPLLLILFTEHKQAKTFSSPSKKGKSNSVAAERKIKKLEEELAAAYADALAFSQDQKAYTEELQSASEEVVSSNEELQTVNEELETSKEEIESANEELITTNQELQMRNDLLSESYDYTEAVIATIHDSMIVLDKNLRIVSASESFYKNFGVTDTETKGMLLYDLGNRQWNIPRLREFLEDIVPKNAHFQDFEVTHNFPHLGEKIMLLNASRILQKSKREPLILLSIQDITDMRDKANELQAKEKKYLSRFQNLLMEAPAIVCVLRGPTHIYELANTNYIQLVGNRHVVGKPIREALPELEGQGFYEILDAVYKTGKSFVGNEMPIKLDKGNGKVEDCCFNFVYQASYNEGEIDGILVYGVEVTEQVNARKKIEDNAEQIKRFKYMADNANDAFILMREDGTFAYLNARALESWGYTAEQATQLRVPDVDPIYNIEVFNAAFEKAQIEKIPPFETLHKRKDGTIYPVEVNMVGLLLNSIPHMFAVARDITERKKSEEKIREGEQRLRLANEASGVAVWEWNVITGLIKWDNEMFKIYGVTPTVDNLVDYTTWSKAVVPEELAQQENILQNTVKNKGQSSRSFSITRESDGELRHIEAIETVRTNASGQAEWVVGTNLDVTEKVLARKKVEESEQRFRLAIAGTNQTVFSQDKNLKHTWIYNPHPNFKAEDIIGKKDEDMHVPASAAILTALKQQVLDTGTAFTGDIAIEVGGQKANFTLHVEPIKDKDETITGIIGNAIDITERIESQQKIEESEQRFQAAIQAVKGILWTNNSKGEMEGEQAGWAALTGQTYEQYQGHGWAKAVHPDDAAPTLKAWEEAVQERKTFIFEHRLKTKNGEWRDFSIRAIPLLKADGTLLQWVGVHTDITENKQAAKALKENEEKFRLLADSMPQFVWTGNEKGELNYFNQAVYKYSGLTKEDIARDGWLQIVHPDEREENIKQWLHSIETGETFHFEHRFRRFDGEYRWQLSRAIPQRDETGKIQMWVGTSTDIQEQKTFAQALEEQVITRTAELKASEEKFYNLFNLSPISKTLSDTSTGKIVMVNDAFTKLFGYSREETLHKSSAEMGLLDLEARASMINELKANGKIENKELGFIKKSGERFFALASAEVITMGDKQFFLSAFNDISEIKKAEQHIKQKNIELENKTIQLEEAQQLAHIGSWEWDVAANKIEWSDELFRLFGLTPQEFDSNYENYLKYIHADDREYVNSIVQQALKDHQPYSLFHKVAGADGKIRIISATGKVITDGDGNVIRMSGTAQDVTAQKNYEEELKISEERFYKIFDNNPVAMYLSEIKTQKIKYANSRFYSAFGFTEKDVIGRSSQELNLLDPEETKRVGNLLLGYLLENRSLAEVQALSPEEREALLLKLKQSEKMKDFEMLYTRTNGEKFHAIVSFEVIRIGFDSYTVTSCQDITERKKAEALLRSQNDQLEKMNKELESFAYISSHDLQEPLRKIQTFASRITEKEAHNLSDIGKDMFNRMKEDAKRMQTLIQDLLAYSRTNTAERKFKTIDLNEIIAEVKEDLDEELKEKHATIEANQLCEAEIIHFQFRQLMHNLIGNSLKFSNPENPPHIQIKSEIANGIKFNNEKLSPQKKYCHISVSDNGIGFEQQYSEKIFEVFQRLHSTNEYNGTGIGLSIVKKIVENHHGIITAKGELNKGAIFDIYIPAT